MKLDLENGYVIVIDETEDGITVSATKDDEEVESFHLELGESEEGGEEGQDFDDNEGGQELPDEGQGQAQSQGQMEDESPKLESFAAFTKRMSGKGKKK